MSDPLTTTSARVVIREVDLRDGLQSIRTILPTERKCEWIRAAVAAGQCKIEIGSFVPPKLLPLLADTGAVLAYAKTLPGLFASVLIPNLKGAGRALEGGADLMILPLSASHAHSLANLRKTPDEVVAELGRIRAARDAAGSKTLIEGGVGTAFGCTLQGEVKISEVLRLLQALLDAGADRVSIGGCPHAPGTGGNAATEDLAFMLAAMGLDTGIDVEALLVLRAQVAGWLTGEQTHGTLWRAGLPKTFASNPAAAAA